MTEYKVLEERIGHNEEIIKNYREDIKDLHNKINALNEVVNKMAGKIIGAISVIVLILNMFTIALTPVIIDNKEGKKDVYTESDTITIVKLEGVWSTK